LSLAKYMRFLKFPGLPRAWNHAIVLRCGIDPCSSCYVPGTEAATNSQEMVEETAGRSCIDGRILAY
jgi:hypothetical protein